MNRKRAWRWPLAFAALFLFAHGSTCVTWKLEHGLDKSLRSWLDEVSILMNSDVPEDIAGRKGMSEYGYFLRLSPELRARYREMFWKIRYWGMEAKFQGRLQYVRRSFQNNLWNPMAQQIILCGMPDDINLYTVNGDDLGLVGVGDSKGYDEVLAIWSYYVGAYIVRFGFICKGMVWSNYPISVGSAADQHRFLRQCQWEWAPTWVGYDEWREVLKK